MVVVVAVVTGLGHFVELAGSQRAFAQLWNALSRLVLGGVLGEMVDAAEALVNGVIIHFQELVIALRLLVELNYRKLAASGRFDAATERLLTLVNLVDPFGSRYVVDCKLIVRVETMHGYLAHVLV